MRIGYCRVSTKEQALDGNALKQQIDRIKNQGVDKIYFDIESGTKDKRPDFKKLLADIKKGIVTEIVITRMDRLTRSLRTQLELIPLFEQYKIKLTALDQHIDFTTAGGKLNLNINGVLSQNYCDELSEKIKHGYDYYRKIKKSSRSVFGYKIVDTKIVIDNDPFLCVIENKLEYSKYNIAREVIESYLKYKSISGCLRHLNQYFGLSKKNVVPKPYKSLHFSSAGIANYLVHPVLRGYLVYFQYNKQVPTQLFPNNHTPILSELEYAEILSILQHNKKVRGYGFVSNNPFTGLIYCQNCSWSMKISKIFNRNKTSFYEYYNCQNALEKGCHNSKAVRLDRIKFELFKNLQSKYQQLIELTNLPLDILTDSKEVQSLRSQINSLSLLPKNPAIDQAIANIQLQIQSLQSEQSQNQLVHSDNEDYLKALFSSTSFWETLLPHQLKEIVQKLVNKILILDGEVIEIKLNC
jgi:DNA invertase Pin-like site-specific DNA recombinase